MSRRLRKASEVLHSCSKKIRGDFSSTTGVAGAYLVIILCSWGKIGAVKKNLEQKDLLVAEINRSTSKS